MINDGGTDIFTGGITGMGLYGTSVGSSNINADLSGIPSLS